MKHALIQFQTSCRLSATTINGSFRLKTSGESSSWTNTNLKLLSARMARTVNRSMSQEPGRLFMIRASRWYLRMDLDSWPILSTLLTHLCLKTLPRILLKNLHRLKQAITTNSNPTATSQWLGLSSPCQASKMNNSRWPSINYLVFMLLKRPTTIWKKLLLSTPIQIRSKSQ
jgi:hypothetical protein